jgi:pyridoxamine-phosphate oxidase
MADQVLKSRASVAIFDIKDLPSSSDPFVVFGAWLKEAEETPTVVRPKAMSLATCSREGRPSLRSVLLARFDGTEIVFESYDNSRKGKELEENPFVATSFTWNPLGREVRIEGRVEKLSREREEEIFYSKPKEIQTLIAASPNQSTVVASRSGLEEERVRLQKQYKDPSSVIPCPLHWVAYSIIPSSFQFYQGHPPPKGCLDLSDRFLFTRRDDHTWKVDRLAP